MDLTTAADAVDRNTAIDRIADPLAKTVGGVVNGPVKDALNGRWLGHPLHPALTDVVIGCWTSANLLDLVGGRRGRVPARRLVGLGVLAAGPTAAAGLADWLDGDEKIRRTGVVHAAGNTVALSLYVASWRARRRERWLRGTLLGLAGSAVASGSAYLGGHLTYALASGVQREPVIEDLPAAVPDGVEASLTGVRIGG